MSIDLALGPRSSLPSRQRRSLQTRQHDQRDEACRNQQKNFHNKAAVPDVANYGRTFRLPFWKLIGMSIQLAQPLAPHMLANQRHWDQCECDTNHGLQSIEDERRLHCSISTWKQAMLVHHDTPSNRPTKLASLHCAPWHGNCAMGQQYL